MTGQALRAVRDLPVVVDAVAAEDRPDHDGTVVEVTCHPSCDRVPPAVARRLAAFDLGIVSVMTRESPERYIVEAV